MSNSVADVIARIGGPESYSDKAAKKIFGESAKILECKSITKCFRAVLDGKAGVALVPAHNTIIGDIPEGDETVKTLADKMGLSCVKKHRLRIRLVLASHGKVDEIKIVYSKLPALAQCKKFSKSHKGITMTDIFNNEKIPDTSAAVEIVKALDVGYAAAICDADAAKHHDVPVALDHVADRKENFTTFFLYKNKTSKTAKRRATGKRRSPQHRRVR